MELFTIDAEKVKVDGGASFGVVPKTIWSKYCKSDENNLIDISLRCLLIKDGSKLILIDTGCGNKQSDKFYSYLYVTGRNNLQESFIKYGFSFEDVTDVILSHLHYDHCGGAVIFNKISNKLEPAFKNAIYWCTKSQWKRANNPFIIERASYFKENFVPLYDAGILNFLEKEGKFNPNIYLKIVNGHTTGQIVPIINYYNATVVYTADFIPSSAHIQLTHIPAYDYEPLISLKEKEDFLNIAAERNYVLFLEHDIDHECCIVEKIDKGFKVKDAFALSEIKKYI